MKLNCHFTLKWYVGSNLTLYRNTVSERITSIIHLTDTDRIVPNDAAFAVGTTTSRTRISATLVQTCQIRRAVWIDCTFRSAIWWNTDHRILATAFGTFIEYLTNGIGSTGRRNARINRWNLNRWLWNHRQRLTSDERITRKSFFTITNWIMVYNATFGFLATDSCTRITAFLVNAG